MKEKQMSTRSLIAIENADKSVKSTYCHFDGYIDGVGVILHDHYGDREKVEALLSLGYLSSIKPRLAPEPGEEHSYDNPVDDICIAYHRDRGEILYPTTKWTSAKEMLIKASDQFCAEYCYLFRDSQWFVDEPYNKRGWRSLTEELKEANNEITTDFE